LRKLVPMSPLSPCCGRLASSPQVAPRRG
jgi:hypothetical protein